MTQIGHIVIGLIVVLAAVYLGIYLRQKMIARKVSKLLQEVVALKARPVRERLDKGHKLSLTGQSLQQFEILERKYKQLEKTGFEQVVEQGDRVIYETQGLNILQSDRSLKELEAQVAETTSTVTMIEQGLTDLEQIDLMHRQAVEALEAEYQDLRKQLLSENFRVGPAIEKLEEILGSLEDDFAEFARLTEIGDHVEASQIHETLSMETTQLEQRIEQIPALYEALNVALPDQFTELQTRYETMRGEGFMFVEDIEGQLLAMETQRETALDDLAELKLKSVGETITNLEDQTEQLYATFNAEEAAAEQVLADNENINRFIKHNRTLNHDLELELERMSKDFVFTHDEETQIKSWRIQLSNVDMQFSDLELAIERHEVVFTETTMPQEKMREELTRIEQEELQMWDMVKSLPQTLKQAKGRLFVLKEKLRQIQRGLERQGLSGLPVKYMDDFYVVSDELGRLERQMNLSRVNIDDVVRQLSIVTADLDTLDEQTYQLIQAAAVTERLVRQASRYKNDADVRVALQQARYYYESEYDYEQAMRTLGDALEQLEPGLTESTIQTYRQEQATLRAEFAEKAAQRDAEVLKKPDTEQV